MDNSGRGSIGPSSVKQQWAYLGQEDSKKIYIYILRIRNKIISLSILRDAEVFTARE